MRIRTPLHTTDNCQSFRVTSVQSVFVRYVRSHNLPDILCIHTYIYIFFSHRRSKELNDNIRLKVWQIEIAKRKETSIF